MIYELLLSIKSLILLIPTVFLFGKFIKNYSSGIIYYICFLAIVTLIGFSTPILFPTSFFLLVILRELIVKKDNLNLLYILIFIYTLSITYINGSSFIGFDQNLALGILMLSVPVSNWLYFQTTFKLIISLLSFIISYCLFIFFKVGTDLFDFNYIVDGGSRLLTIQSYLSSQTDDVKLDPNFLSVHAGFGIILTLILYRFYLKSSLNFFKTIGIKFINNKFKLHVLFFALIIFFSLIFIRGFSRGAILAFISSIIFMFNFKLLSKHSLVPIFVVLFLIFNFNISDIIVNRFIIDDKLGGRYLIWDFLYNWTLQNYTFILGTGLNYPWWNDWQLDYGYIGLHNSWLTLFLRIGVFIFFILFINIFRKIVKGLFSKSPILIIKRGIFVYIFVAALSIDLMNGIFWWIAFAFSVSNSSKLNFNKL